MARNEEKAQSMLYRFREAMDRQQGIVPRTQQKRPASASQVTSLGAAERWRRQLIGEISKKIAKIHDPSLTDYQIRDMNDDINRSMRERMAWEHRILELGGPNYFKIASKMIDADGREVPGSRGYKYFGRARELPGVRELFEEEAPQPPKKTRHDLQKGVDADYYGYRDEEDGLLLEYEQKKEQERIEQYSAEMDDEEGSKKGKGDAIGIIVVPTQKEIERYLVERRRQQLMDRYVSDEVSQAVQ